LPPWHSFRKPWKKGPLEDPDSIILLLEPYVKNREIYICPGAVAGVSADGRSESDPVHPSTRSEWVLTYLCNPKMAGKPYSAFEDVSDETVYMKAAMVFDDCIGRPGSWQEELSRAPHFGKFNMLYLDGHVKLRKRL